MTFRVVYTNVIEIEVECEEDRWQDAQDKAYQELKQMYIEPTSFKYYDTFFPKEPRHE